LERLYFYFQFYFVLSAAINGWTPTNLFWRRRTPFFIAKNTLVFTLIVQRVFCFSRTAFSFHFSPWFLFRSCYIFASRCIYTTGLRLFSSKELSQKGLKGVGKEKKSFMPKVVQMVACLDCGLDFCMSCLMSFW
jgi:hypothetical protein